MFFNPLNSDMSRKCPGNVLPLSLTFPLKNPEHVLFWNIDEARQNVHLHPASRVLPEGGMTRSKKIKTGNKKLIMSVMRTEHGSKSVWTTGRRGYPRQVENNHMQEEDPCRPITQVPAHETRPNSDDKRTADTNQTHQPQHPDPTTPTPAD